jgi:phosphorylcholine metabolism protein LicD
MNEKFEVPRKDIERMIEENDADAKYWAERNNTTMAEWHTGRASMLRLLISLWG